MGTRRRSAHKLLFAFVVALITVLLSAALGAAGNAVYADDPQPITPIGDPIKVNDYLTVVNYRTAQGEGITKNIINGPPGPPSGYGSDDDGTVFPAASKILTLPGYTWVFGCSAVSGAMIAGYYDRNGYPNMYTGPTAGGVMPLTNASWPTWNDGYKTYPNNPLVASHQGVDGRTTKGSIDDYWVKYLSTAADPYIGHWAQHTWGSAIGDYMKTSQSAYGNTDGSTAFFTYTTSPNKLTCSAMTTMDAGGGMKVSQVDGTFGRKLFYQKKGYTVTECYNQKTDNNGGGFTLANYRAQIDAGRPVMLNLAGHTVAGVGYEIGTSKIYIHDTWSTTNHSMTWGSYYQQPAMKLLSVSIVNITGGAPVTVPTPKSPSGTITDKTPTYTWTKVASATSYQFALMKGTTPIYTKTVASSACGASTCSNTPANTLTLGSYKWRARAMVGGVWKAWSAYKNFTVATSSGFNSQFNGSAAGWVKRPGAAWSLASGTTYYTTGVAGKVSSVSYNATFGNFTYQAKVKRTDYAGDTDHYSAGLVVRGTPTFDAYNDWKNAYEFLYTQTGHFSVWKGVGGSWTLLKGWTSSSSIVPNGWNTLKLVASGTSLRFYINGTLVWSGSDSAFSSGQVGLWMFRGSPVERFDADWATLTVGAPDVLASEPIEQGQVELPFDPAHPYSRFFAPVP